MARPILNLYGNTLENQKEVRELKGGRMKLKSNNLPPFDVKYNSSPGVFAYHNLLVDQFAKEYDTLNDEELFQKTRRQLIAIYQHIAQEKYIRPLL
jgi:hypothetical protein